MADAVRALVLVSPINGPISVSIVFLFSRPKRLMRKKDPAGRIPHTSKPDRDNLDKAVLDVLTATEVLADDAIVCQGSIAKWYCALDEPPGAEIIIEEASCETETSRS